MSERGVVDAVDVERGGAVVAEPGLQRELLVRPDARAQVVEEFDDDQCLLGRPVRVDQEGQALGDARGLRCGAHGWARGVLRRDAVVRSWASLRR